MRGGDKALPPPKAKAKAGRYQLIIKAVDDWRSSRRLCLTDFRGTCRRDIWAAASKLGA
jgi:hypothetical protein